MTEAPEAWATGPACCHDCGCGWLAVWPLGCPALECPNCGSTDTDREAQSAHDPVPDELDETGVSPTIR